MRRGSAITHMSHNLINQAKHIVKQKPAVQAFNYTSPNRIHWQSESPKRIDQYAHAWGLTQHIKPTFCVDL